MKNNPRLSIAKSTLSKDLSTQDEKSKVYFDISDDLYAIEKLIRAIVCTIEHPGFGEEADTIDHLCTYAERHLKAIKATLGVEQREAEAA